MIDTAVSMIHERARRYPVELQERCGGERIKALEEARRLALQEGNLRVVRRTSVLHVGAGRTVGERAAC